MIPLKTIEELINKHASLEKELSSGLIDKKNFAEKSKDYSDLNEIIREIKEYYSFEVDQKDLEKIINDEKKLNVRVLFSKPLYIVKSLKITNFNVQFAKNLNH